MAQIDDIHTSYKNLYGMPLVSVLDCEYIEVFLEAYFIMRRALELAEETRETFIRKSVISFVNDISLDIDTEIIKIIIKAVLYANGFCFNICEVASDRKEN